MRVLITGGAGYIGSVLVERLLSAGYRVTVLDNLLWGQTSLFGFCHLDGFEFVAGDARDESLLQELIKDHDVLIPLACLVGAPACEKDRTTARTVNYEAVASLNRLRSSEQWVIYPNTNSGYGARTGEVFCTEETLLEPISYYGQTKVQAETELLQSENTLTLRLATVFGMSYRLRLDLLVNDFVHQAVHNRSLVLFEEHFKRNYIHIRDVADCFLHCIENFEKMKGRAYNAGLDGANLSKHELALLIKSFVPELSIHLAPIGEDQDKRNYIVSNARLKEAGFEAGRTLESGIQELLKGYRMLARRRHRNI